MTENDRDEIVRRLRDCRQALRELRSGVDTPAVYQALKMAEMNLHWGQWLLGDLDEVMPELEEEAAGPRT